MSPSSGNLRGAEQRPALRKAGDAELHPSTPLPDDAEPSFLRRGAVTADAIGSPDKDRLVDLDVQVPKSLRKSLKAEAKRRGISLDHLVADALRERTGR